MKSKNTISINNLVIVCGYGLITLGILSLLAKLIVNL